MIHYNLLVPEELALGDRHLRASGMGSMIAGGIG